jgi:hypothetical protein
MMILLGRQILGSPLDLVTSHIQESQGPVFGAVAEETSLVETPSIDKTYTGKGNSMRAAPGRHSTSSTSFWHHSLDALGQTHPCSCSTRTLSLFQYENVNQGEKKGSKERQPTLRLVNAFIAEGHGDFRIIPRVPVNSHR